MSLGKIRGVFLVTGDEILLDLGRHCRGLNIPSLYKDWGFLKKGVLYEIGRMTMYRELRCERSRTELWKMCEDVANQMNHQDKSNLTYSCEEDDE